MKTALISQIVFILFFAHSSFATITVTPLNSLSFGKFAANSGGTITVSPAGARTRSGGVAILTSEPGSAARFRVTGDIGQSFIVSLPLDNEVTLTSNGNTMSLTNFTLSPSNPGSLDGNGEQILFLGATLNIDSNKPQGDYNGVISFTIDYQ